MITDREPGTALAAAPRSQRADHRAPARDPWNVDLHDRGSVSPDGRTVIVDLRTDVRFHDGEPFTADDVVFTWEALTDPALASPVYGSFDLEGLVTSGEAVDADTVRFQLGRNDPSFTEKLYVGIVPEHILTGQDLKSTDFNRIPICTGPYTMGERRAGERMVLEANESYYGGAPAIKKVVYTFIPDENARTALDPVKPADPSCSERVGRGRPRRSCAGPSLSTPCPLVSTDHRTATGSAARGREGSVLRPAERAGDSGAIGSVVRRR